jgi:hypothetical protein
VGVTVGFATWPTVGFPIGISVGDRVGSLVGVTSGFTAIVYERFCGATESGSLSIEGETDEQVSETTESQSSLSKEGSFSGGWKPDRILRKRWSRFLNLGSLVRRALIEEVGFCEGFNCLNFLKPPKEDSSILDSN